MGSRDPGLNTIGYAGSASYTPRPVAHAIKNPKGLKWEYQVAGANRRWRCQFRCRGSRRESAVAQLFSLGSKIHAMKKCTYCGKEQPDAATTCPIDGEPLKTVITQPSPTPPPPTSAQLSPPKPRPLAIRIIGWIGLIFGGLITASQLAQMVMGMSPGIVGLVVGLLIVFGSLSMAMPPRRKV